MKRINRIVLVIISLAVILSGCKKSLEQQIAEQLELGQRYLTEMNYKEAVVAFQKVIELDEKIIDAYWGLGQAYEEVPVRVVLLEKTQFICADIMGQISVR